MKIKHVLGVSFFSLVLGLGFVACSDDDDDNTPQAPSEVVGIWKYSTVKSNVEVTDEEIKDAVIEYIENLPNEGVDTYNLKANKTYELRMVGAEKDSTGNYIYNNGKITFDSKSDVAYAKDTISDMEDVKKAVAEALDLDETKITKAESVKIYKRISK
jgi:hypothetical protein